MPKRNTRLCIYPRAAVIRAAVAKGSRHVRNDGLKLTVAEAVRGIKKPANPAHERGLSIGDSSRDVHKFLVKVLISSHHAREVKMLRGPDARGYSQLGSFILPEFNEFTPSQR